MQKISIDSPPEDFFASHSPEEYKKVWPQYVIKLKNVYIVNHGVVLDSNFKYIKDCNFSYAFWNNLKHKNINPRNMRGYINSQFNFGSEIEGEREVTLTLDKNINYVHAFHYFNWYPFGHHWEIIQPLKNLSSFKEDDFTLLLSSGQPNSIKGFDRQLDLLGFKKTRRLDMRKECVFVPTLFYCSPIAYFSQVTPSGLDYINNAFEKIKTPVRKNRLKLYLSRQAANKRKVVNSKDVEALLISKGFVIVDGSESFETHLELFRNAEMIVGPHGSMFNNILFCPNDVKIIEFCPENRKDRNFLGLGLSRKLEYHWLESSADKYHNITIDLEVLKKFL